MVLRDTLFLSFVGIFSFFFFLVTILAVNILEIEDISTVYFIEQIKDDNEHRSLIYISQNERLDDKRTGLWAVELRTVMAAVRACITRRYHKSDIHIIENTYGAFH